MTNSIAYANPAATNFGTLTLETLRVSDTAKDRAEEVIRSWLPDSEAAEVLSMLGLEKEEK